MSESYIQLPPDSTGKKARTIERTVAGQTVHERVVTIAEPISGIIIDPRYISGVVRAFISGETVTLASGTGPILARSSGEIYIAKVSGETVVAKVSGETVIGKVSGEAVIARVSGPVVVTSGLVEVRPTGYEKAVVSGAVIANITSGMAVLHTVTINDYTSGFTLIVRDSASGAAGTVVAQVFAPSRTIPPATLIFDCVMYSGIVVTTSGATWHATVTFRKPF